MRIFNRGVMALTLIGGFVAWRNRFRIQRYLESRGIEIPVFGNNLGEKAQSLGAKVIGKTENVLGVKDRDLDADLQAVS